VRYVKQQGVSTLARHEERLARRLWEQIEPDGRFILHGARPDGVSPRTGVVSLNLKGRAASEVEAILDTSFDIAVRGGLHCAPGAHRFEGTFPEGTVRVSPGPFNTEADVDALVSALREIAGDLS